MLTGGSLSRRIPAKMSVSGVLFRDADYEKYDRRATGLDGIVCFVFCFVRVISCEFVVSGGET